MKGTHATDYCTPDLLLPEGFSGQCPTHRGHKWSLKKTKKKKLLWEADIWSCHHAMLDFISRR